MNIVLFDGVCNLCNSTVLFLIKHDRNNNLHFAAQQTDAGINLLKESNFMVSPNLLSEKNSVILLKEGQVFYKSDAIIEISKLLTGWPHYIKYVAIFPRWFRDFFYDVVANYRYTLFGKRKECSIPAEPLKHKFI
jgi:predicted DCC family thiol-disulfide oxidoreductase YuxK